MAWDPPHKACRSITVAHAVSAAVLFVLAGAGSASQVPSAPDPGHEVSELVPQVSIERTITGGEAHAFRIPLAAGHYVHLTLDQGFIDLVVRVTAPATAATEEIDSRWHGLESVSVLARTGGEYTFEVRTSSPSAVATTYRMAVVSVLPADDIAGRRITAERLATEGKRLVTQGTAESLRAAVKRYEEVLPIWRALGDRHGEAQTLNTLGYTLRYLGQTDRAMALLREAVSSWTSLNNPTGQGEALVNLGAVYSRLGEKREAAGYYTQSLELARSTGNRSQQALLHNNLGTVYSELGEISAGLAHFQQAQATWQQLREPLLEAVALANVGATYKLISEQQQALEHLQRALPLFQAGGNRLMEIAALNNIGQVYSALGDGRRALDYYGRALPLAAVVGEKRLEPATLHNIGSSLRLLDEGERAADYFQQAVPLWRAAGDPRGEATSWTQLGDIHISRGEPQRATEYFDNALRLFQSIGDRRNEAYALTGRALAEVALGNPQRALEVLDLALARSRDVADRATEAQVLLHRATLQRDAGDFVQAALDIDAALDVIESLRLTVVSPELRISYHASKQQFYEFYVDLLMRRHAIEPTAGFDTLALQVNERARARSLLDMLTEARAEIRYGVDPDLIDRERAVQRLLNDKAERQTRLLSGPRSDAVTKELSRLDADIRDLLDEYRTIQSRVRVASPRYAALMRPTPLSVSEIQRQVLDGDTLLLHFSLGEPRSHVFALSSTELTSHQLAGRREIESAARDYYQRISQDGAGSGGLPRSSELDAGIARSATRLSDLLLAPVAERLSRRRLLIVADGILQYVPLAALPSPRGGRQPLVVEHEVVTAPSASTIALLRAEASARSAAPKTMAVFGDPVFSADDPRVKARLSETRQSRAGESGSRDRDDRLDDLDRAALDTGDSLFPLSRLPFTRREAESILKLVRPDDGLKALDFDASVASVASSRLSQYRIVHLATHGFINTAHPELSGLVLSLVDAAGRAQPGFLRAHDIYNLKLSAELVVLSACRSALGADVRGEGLLGLTRGFMYAGASRVVASLWKVDDEATAELMERFYTFHIKGGLPAAAALRHAQLAMLRSRRWGSPRHWAAFVLQGEWN